MRPHNYQAGRQGALLRGSATAFAGSEFVDRAIQAFLECQIKQPRKIPGKKIYIKNL